MIITTKKQITQILDLLKPHEKIFLIGCGSCSTVCLTGGENQVKEMAEVLQGKAPYKYEVEVEKEYVDEKGKTKKKKELELREDKVKENHVIVGSIILDEPCDQRLGNSELIKAEGLDKADAVLVMSCGVGMQTVYDFLVKSAEKGKIPRLPKVFVSNDTHFMGQTERIGVFHEMCRGCGDCMLNETAGICPVVRCGKSLMNGPCGGMINGKCEVKDYTLDCGWALLYQRLKLVEKLEKYVDVNDPKDFALMYATRDVSNR
nr:methylenetetrahydrofolate reductase C-terminal domain-containing protein [Candidatus Sigynarchaeota archaeon]